MDQLSNVLQIHSHQQDMMASHPHYQYLDNINLISSTSKQQQQSTPPHQDSHHQQTPQPPSDKKPRPPDETPKCPRCDSANTKFCYYNNYSLTQPRYFCKSCRRYWTKGGTLRNVPVGGGCRKNNKRSSSSSTSSSSPSSPSSSLTSPSMFIKRTLLAAAATSSHRDQFELQPHHQMMMMMMGGGGGGDGSGGNNSTTGSVALHPPTTTSGILHLPFSYDHHQESNSCDLSLAFARLQQRINQQGDQFSDNRHGLENIDHDTSTIGSGGTAGGTTTTSIDSVIIAHGQQNQGSGGDQSYMVDSFRDGISYVNHHQQQHSLNNNQPDTENNNNNNGGMNSFFHNLNLLSYGLPAAHHNITVSNEQKTEDLLLPYHEMDPLSSVGAGNNTTTTTTHSAAAVTTMKHEPLWDSTDHTKLPWGLGFPWQQVMMNGDHQSGMNVGGDAGETGKNWINVNGRVMNIGSLQVGMDY